jgi:hypothetical protein
MGANAAFTFCNKLKESPGFVSRGLGEGFLNRFPNIVSLNKNSFVMVMKFLPLFDGKPCAPKPNYV